MNKVISYVNELDKIHAEQQLYSRKAYIRKQDLAEEIFADWHANEVMSNYIKENRIYKLIKELKNKYSNIESELQEIFNMIVKSNKELGEFSAASKCDEEFEEIEIIIDEE